LVHERIQELKELGIIDYVIFDTPPTPSLLHASIYMATDSMLIPTQPEATSLLGLGRTVKFREYYTKQRAALDLPAIELMGVIPTMTTYNAKEHTGNFGTLVDVYGQSVIWRGIPRRIAWGEASAKRNSIFAHALENPQAEPAAKDAWGVVKGVLEYEPAQ
jgi:cellulose biosynthesis protein BcsQ